MTQREGNVVKKKRKTHKKKHDRPCVQYNIYCTQTLIRALHNSVAEPVKSSGTEGRCSYKLQGVQVFLHLKTEEENTDVITLGGGGILAHYHHYHHHKAWESKAARTLTTLSMTFNSLTL